jgi:8-oxo-dGTP pyrophosphatase MutT (NUDIX family)
VITLGEGTARFSYRVAGVAMNRGRVLLHRLEGDSKWAMPGGRVEWAEQSPDALRREMLEEIGVNVDVVRLLWVVERFYTKGGISYHELGLYHLMNLPSNCPPLMQESFDGREGASRLVFRWFDASDLLGVELYPAFLRQALRQIPLAPQHVIHVDPV